MSIDKLVRSARKKPLFVPGQTTHTVSLGRSELHRMVPHREPFLLVDGIDAVDLEEQAVVGRRYIDPGDPVFAGHFPGDPVYPGVLQIEAMAQLSICLKHLCDKGRVEVLPEDSPPALRLLKIHSAAFLAEVRPDTTLELVARAVEDNGYTAILAG